MTPKEINENLYWAEKLTFSEKKQAIREAKIKKYMNKKHGHKWPKDPYWALTEKDYEQSDDIQPYLSELPSTQG